MTMTGQSPLAEMVAQSRDVITNPSVATFERYEKRGNLGTAGVYVLVAAVVAGVLTALVALLSGSVGGALTGLIAGTLGALTSFLIFTALVYYLGRSLGGGSGSWDEVAYSFALFAAPLSVAGAALAFIVTLLGWIPVLGWIVAFAGGLAGLVVVIAQIFFGYLAVQSSMNISDTGRALLVLVLAGVGTIAAQMVLGALSGLLLPLLLLVAVAAGVMYFMSNRRGAYRR
jgi:hypothetical protein